jgi:hypothetical protein
MNLCDPYLISIIFGIQYFVFAILIHFLSFRFIRKASKNILLPIDQVDILQEKMLKNSPDNKKVTILIDQFNISTHLKSYYRNLAISFYQNYYVFTICSIVYTIFLAIAVFLLAADGWKDSPPCIKVIVLMTLFFAAYYYFLPNVLNNKLNLQKNMDCVKFFQKLQLDILSFLNRINSIDENEIDIFITNIYIAIKDNYDYNISFDTSLLDKNPLDNFKGLKPK